MKHCSIVVLIYVLYKVAGTGTLYIYIYIVKAKLLVVK